MRRITLVAALLGAIVLAFAGVATADTVTSTPGNSVLGGASNNGTQVTHYTANYDDPFFGSVSCIGVHQEKKGKAPQDSFTCTSTSGSPFANVAPGQTITLATITGWISDVSGAYATGLNGTVSADGMSYSAVATY